MPAASVTAGLADVAARLRRETGRLRFAAPVTHIYSPLEYAWEPYRQYLERYARPGIDALLVGMNPGPHGMAQTGVPFGDVASVRDWLRIEGPVGRPDPEHPRRPVHGFAGRRGEVSGARLWGWARARYGTPQRFFRRFFVWNYCPLCFLEASGRNLTPDKLPAAAAAPLYAACDRALAEVVDFLQPRLVVGVGAFAEKRAVVALAGHEVRIGAILHPSPASPAANRGWAAQAEAGLRALGVEL
ncbi:MAG: single-stranded DNA-binding protein [Planctomycetota bacterium]|nr:MAG: single-stranded DNA-binding protein [Planctomycetota bacterium]